MKKVIIMFCAAAMLFVVGCQKDNAAPSGNNSGNNSDQQLDKREGAYDPVCKITGVAYSDNTENEVWVWDNGKLQRVNQDVLFTYRSDGRVDKVEIHNIQTGGLLPGNGLSGTMNVTYDGEYISQLAVANNGTQVLSAQVQHDPSSHKVSGATLDLSNTVLLDLFNMMLAQFLNDSTFSDDVVTSVDNVSGSVAFQWTGDNVSQALLNIGFRAATTIGTFVNLVGEDNLSMFGTYGSALALAATLVPNQPLYFDVVVGDTVDYSYDNKVNPFWHYLGQVNISCLSVNNVEMEAHNGSAAVAISTTLGMQNVNIYNTNYPLPLGTTVYQYKQYNDKGCPLRVENSDGLETEYTYMN